MGNMDPSELLDIYQTGFRCCMVLTILSIAAAVFIFFRKDIRSILMKKTGIGRRNAISRMRERNIQNDGRRAVDVDLEFNSTDYTETGGVPADRSAEVLGKKSGEVSLRREERTASIKSKSINLRKRDKAASKEVSETVPLSDKAKAALKEEAETALLENGTDEQTAETELLDQGADVLSDTVPLTLKKEEVLREEAETELLSKDTEAQTAETELLTDNDTDEKNTELHARDAAVSEKTDTVLLTHNEQAAEGSAETVLLKKDSRPSKEKKGSGFVISERILVVHTDEEIGM